MYLTFIICILFALCTSHSEFGMFQANDTIETTCADSVIVDKQFLCVIDSVIANNEYYNNLTAKDKAEYQHCMFIVDIDTIIVQERVIKCKVLCCDRPPRNKELRFFKIKNHLLFLNNYNEDSFFFSVSKGHNKSFSQPVIDNPNSDGCFEPGVNIDISYRKDDNVVLDVKDNSVPDIYYVSDTNAEFVGGQEKMNEYILHLHSELSIKNGDEMIVRFIIEKDGTISNMTILKELPYVNKGEVQYLLTHMPKWKPASHHNRSCRIYYYMKIK